MKQLLALAFCVLGFVLYLSCNGKQNPDDTRNLKRIIDHSVLPSDSNVLYFPVNKHLSDTTNQLSKFSNTWYSKMLFALNEPVLFISQDSSEIFRFTWLRTFHNPISIRVNKNREHCVLTLKILGGAGGYEPEDLIKDTSYFITMNEWKTLASKISEINFWKLKSFVDDDGKDGSEWILEGKNNYEYHFVNRWSPNATRYKEFKDCCDYLIYLSNIKLTNKEIY